ncbi:hypothetical protein JZ751_023860 [Albula glossodonta]|uniref:Uncharacterized protein n=1 Tax=Albula glossodonta TaxID=121402 RepID=A0A8T2NG07_9TELE|nr:hypothetical protein JZ751_023860 [Albula glossodonta]
MIARRFAVRLCCVDTCTEGHISIGALMPLECKPPDHSRYGLRADPAPCFIPNDRSKKRLIEDTQDWQPRTGTTQSRSFRILAQLTGTDFSKSEHSLYWHGVVGQAV